MCWDDKFGDLRVMHGPRRPKEEREGGGGCLSLLLRSTGVRIQKRRSDTDGDLPHPQRMCNSCPLPPSPKETSGNVGVTPGH